MCSHWICCPLNPYCFTVITVKQMLSYPGLLHSIYLLMQMLDFTFISIIFHPVGFRSVSRNVIKPWFCSSRAITSQPCCLERYCYFCTSGWPMMYIWNLGERWRQETYFVNFHLGNTPCQILYFAYTILFYLYTGPVKTGMNISLYEWGQWGGRDKDEGILFSEGFLNHQSQWWLSMQMLLGTQAL